jgi:hypothetical protein
VSDFKHRPKPTPRDAINRATLPAPLPLGAMRKVSHAADDVMAIAVCAETPLSFRLVLFAHKGSWPKDGGRTIIVASPGLYALGTGVECWTVMQLCDALTALNVGIVLANRVSNFVWKHTLRADPAPWPRDPPMPRVF